MITLHLIVWIKMLLNGILPQEEGQTFQAFSFWIKDKTFNWWDEKRLMLKETNFSEVLATNNKYNTEEQNHFLYAILFLSLYQNRLICIQRLEMNQTWPSSSSARTVPAKSCLQILLTES